MWEIYDALISAVPEDSQVAACLAGLSWFLVRSQGVGVAMRPREGDEVIPNAGRLAGMKTRELAAGIKSWNLYEAALGLAAINSVLRHHVDVDALYVCPHDNDDGCSCRKPKPGMLLRAAAELSLDLRRSFMVGDRWSDVAAGREAGCRTVYIDRGYQEKQADGPDHVVSDPVAAVEWILVTMQEEGGSAGSSSLRHQDLR